MFNLFVAANVCACGMGKWQARYAHIIRPKSHKFIAESENYIHSNVYESICCVTFRWPVKKKVTPRNSRTNVSPYILPPFGGIQTRGHATYLEFGLNVERVERAMEGIATPMPSSMPNAIHFSIDFFFIHEKCDIIPLDVVSFVGIYSVRSQVAGSWNMAIESTYLNGFSSSRERFDVAQRDCIPPMTSICMIRFLSLDMLGHSSAISVCLQESYETITSRSINSSEVKKKKILQR